MRALEWHRRLTDLAGRHGKRLFTRAELANLAGSRIPVAHMQITRLVSVGVLRRYVRGLYGLPGLRDAGELVAALDPSAYVTARHGLFLHGALEQVPSVITAFTCRAWRRRRVETALGPVVFTRVRAPIHRCPLKGGVATAEQCLLDWVWVLLKEGLDPESQGALDTASLDEGRLRALAAFYPRAVARRAARLLARKS